MYVISSTLTLLESFVGNAVSGDSGGALQAVAAQIEVIGSTFSFCSSPTGGALFVDSTQCVLRLSLLANSSGADGAWRRLRPWLVMLACSHLCMLMCFA